MEYPDSFWSSTDSNTAAPSSQTPASQVAQDQTQHHGTDPSDRGELAQMMASMPHLPFDQSAYNSTLVPQEPSLESHDFRATDPVTMAAQFPGYHQFPASRAPDTARVSRALLPFPSQTNTPVQLAAPFGEAGASSTQIQPRPLPQAIPSVQLAAPFGEAGASSTQIQPRPLPQAIPPAPATLERSCVEWLLEPLEGDEMFDVPFSLDEIQVPNRTGDCIRPETIVKEDIMWSKEQAMDRLRDYNEKWNNIAKNRYPVPIPIRSSEEKSLVQFFLAACGIRLQFVPSNPTPESRYSIQTATDEQLRLLELQMCFERRRWEHHTLGQRNNGMAGINQALIDHKLSKMMRSVAQILSYQRQTLAASR
ncbi:MAG: hypothetical protein M1820_007676 [Bogoriella megaspora]|nr:MAG: hypothetical protein M1820_007676 [Bogoriella megaspora]